MKDILDVADVPIIFLSAYGREEQIANAFDMGAADYVVKPFSATELAARIRAALRRRVAAESSEPYVLGDLTVDYLGRRVLLAGRPLRLTPIEYRAAGRAVGQRWAGAAYDRILGRVWGGKGDGDVRPLRTIVGKLRRKLATMPTTQPTSSLSPASATGCLRREAESGTVTVHRACCIKIMIECIGLRCSLLGRAGQVTNVQLLRSVRWKHGRYRNCWNQRMGSD